ncbi:MAG: hypothetical protein WCH85_10165 [Methanomicrobiales archaeon]
MDRHPAFIILLVVLVAVAFITGCTTNTQQSVPAVISPTVQGLPSPSGTNQREPGILFVQESPSGYLVPAADGTYQLTLLNVYPYTTYFSDKPEPQTKFYPMNDYLDGVNWSVKPPAAITRPDAKASEDTLIVTLSNPRYHHATNELIYTVMVIADYQGDGLKELAVSADPALPEELGRVILFIDSVSMSRSDATVCSAGRSCLETCVSKTGKGVCHLICNPFCPSSS